MLICTTTKGIKPNFNAMFFYHGIANTHLTAQFILPSKFSYLLTII